MVDKKAKDRKQNFTPYDCSIRRYEGGFEWTFRAPLAGGYNRNHVITLKFPRWWLTYLTADLLKALEEEEAEVKRIREICGWDKQ